jgi:hypothetical protein
VVTRHAACGVKSLCVACDGANVVVAVVIIWERPRDRVNSMQRAGPQEKAFMPLRTRVGQVQLIQDRQAKR